MTDETSDYLPISMLNQLEYCERRFYLMQVLGEMDINAHVLEGTLRHEQAHTAGAEREGEKVIHRRVYVWSDELRLCRRSGRGEWSDRTGGIQEGTYGQVAQ